MSQTLAQRRVLAARVHDRTATPSRGTAPRADAAASSDPRATAPAAAARSAAPVKSTTPAVPARSDAPAAPDDAGRFRPDSSAAGRAILTLVRAGARVVDVGPRRVLLRRDGSDCEVDRAGRVDWRRD